MNIVPGACGKSNTVGHRLIATLVKPRVLVAALLCAAAALLLAACVIHSVRILRDQGSALMDMAAEPAIRNIRRLDGMSVEELINASSAILYCRNVRYPGEIRHEIEEILFVRQGIAFEHSVGDQFPADVEEVQENTGCGEGQIVFVIGDPPHTTRALDVYADTIASFNDMPLTDFRRWLTAALETEQGRGSSNQSWHKTESKGE